MHGFIMKISFHSCTEKILTRFCNEVPSKTEIAEPFAELLSSKLLIEAMSCFICIFLLAHLRALQRLNSSFEIQLSKTEVADNKTRHCDKESHPPSKRKSHLVLRRLTSHHERLGCVFWYSQHLASSIYI